MKFLGVDLGWVSGASGLCCLELHDPNLQVDQADRTAPVLQLLDLDCRSDISDVLDWVNTCLPSGQPGMVAVDAPTLIPNATGMRLCDRLTHRYFGRYHAGCYPANLTRPFSDRTVGFGLSLETQGFCHAPSLQPRQPGRYQIEVFPHAAMIHLFGLQQILKYKKGRLAERRMGLSQLRQLILKHLPALEPQLCLDDLPEVPQTSCKLKDLEDRLDSLICAYVAAHWWYWGLERNRVLGQETLLETLHGSTSCLSSPVCPENQRAGYIVIPQPLKPGSTSRT